MAEASESRENGMQAESGGLDTRREGENLARFRELACCPAPFYTGFMPDRAIEIKVNTDVASARDGIAALKQTIEEAAQAAAAMNDTLAATGSALDTGSAGTAYADLADSARQASDALNELMGKASELETALAELDGSMPDFAEGVAALESLQSSMEIVVEIQQKVAATAEEIDPNLPWEEFGGKMQSVVEVYTEVEATIIRTTEAVVASEESQQAAAEKKAEAVIAAYQKENAQVTQSLGELKAQLEEYKRKMEEAAAAGDKIGQAEAIKGIEEMTGKITALGKAQEQSAGRAFGMISGFKNLFAMFATGQVSARGLIVSIKSIGTAIKTGLGPVGWGILLLEGLSAAVNVFWNHLTGKSKAAADEAEAARKKAEEEAKKMKEIKMDAVKAENAHEIQKAADYMYNKALKTTIELERQTQEIKHQLALKQGQIDQDIMDINSERDKNTYKLKIQSVDEGWTPEKLEDELQKNEDARAMELDAKKQEKLIAERDANLQLAYGTLQSIFALMPSMLNTGEDIIKSSKDVDLFVTKLRAAYVDRSAKGDRMGFAEKMRQEISKAIPMIEREDRPYKRNLEASSTVYGNRSGFEELGKKLNLKEEEIISILSESPMRMLTMVDDLITGYKEEKQNIDERINKLEGEVNLDTSGAKKNGKGEYDKDDIQKAAAAKGVKVDEMARSYKDGWKLLDQIYKSNQLLEQSIESVGRGMEKRQEISAFRDAANQKTREDEANKYKMEKAFEKIVEGASIDSLKNLYKQAQDALEDAKQSGSKKDIQEAEQFADKVKGILDNKQDAADKMTKEIDDAIAKALKDKNLSKKDRQGLLEMRDKLKKAASDGNLDMSELQQVAPYVDAAAKSAEGVKECVTQMTNATLDMARSQAKIQGEMEGKFQALADHLQKELDNIKRQMKNKQQN
ncbi:hypothetical protein ICN84_11160 [Akkermansia glycaniphila]|uniref:hypothetical protein n=1 Tax=Akkermansia glycaniphila TaxID=1679444 RepID=UPI001C017130|nr:hypothetical protein [Akkermansia glycaniphila]MBT9450625.1 hypothetical protein [Akkermansia glycaniphila]